MPTREELGERLLEVVRTVSEAQRDGVGSGSMCRDILASGGQLATAMGQAFDDQGAVVDEGAVRFGDEFCAFVMQDFPWVLTQGFEALTLRPFYELGAHVPDLEYTYQNAWAAEHVLAIRPEFFVDIGSLAAFVTLVSRTVPCVAIDARPTHIRLANLEYRQGEAQALPLADETAPMVTSLHAPEHFGLGRYGDTLDNRGVERAVEEYLRVLRPGGHLAISMPIGPEACIQFNAARVYSRELMRSLFHGCDILDEMYLGSVPVDYEELLRRAAAGTIQSGVYCLLLRKRP